MAIREIPDALRADMRSYSGCVSGAAVVADTEALQRDAGFDDVRIEVRGTPGPNDFVASAQIQAVKRA